VGTRQHGRASAALGLGGARASGRGDREGKREREKREGKKGRKRKKEKKKGEREREKGEKKWKGEKKGEREGRDASAPAAAATAATRVRGFVRDTRSAGANCGSGRGRSAMRAVFARGEEEKEGSRVCVNLGGRSRVGGRCGTDQYFGSV
jgi:hypothetical protein